LRYLRDYRDAALNVFSGHAVYVGPMFYARLVAKPSSRPHRTFKSGAAHCCAPLTLNDIKPRCDLGSSFKT